MENKDIPSEKWLLLLVANKSFNPLNAELNPIRHLLALVARHIVHVSRMRVKNEERV